jgi:hypothetical protein
LWTLYAFEDELMDELLSSPYLRNLRTLILHHDRNGNLVDDNVLSKAMASPFRGSVEELAVNVDGCWQGPSPRVVQALARSAHLANLRRLNISYSRLDNDTVDLIGESRVLTQLEELDLGGCMLAARVWEAILRLPQLRRLMWLRLEGAMLVDAEGKPLAFLGEVPEYVDAFERRVKTIDWRTKSIMPQWRDCSPTLSWAGRRRDLVFAMDRFLRLKHYDGLEAEYRRLCLQLGGNQVTAEIDGLAFDRYEDQLRSGLEKAIASVMEFEAREVFLDVSLEPDREGIYLLKKEEDDDVTYPCEKSGWTFRNRPLTFPAPGFPEAARLLAAYPLHASLCPSGPGMYVIARMLAAFGRCVRPYDVPVPVRFCCAHYAFQMNEARGGPVVE